MVYLYDEALLNKIKSWTEKTNVYILGPEETTRTFEMIAESNGDKNITLPLICLRRKGGYTLNTLSNVNKTVMTYDGLMLQSNEEKSVSLNAIPITIQYQLDIYCKYLKEADMYAREFIFNIINHPTAKVIVPYNDLNYEHNFNIKLGQEIEDNSDIPEILFKGELSRLSLSLDVDDAYLWDVKVRNNVHISDVGLQIHSKQDDVIVEDIEI